MCNIKIVFFGLEKYGIKAKVSLVYQVAHLQHPEIEIVAPVSVNFGIK